MARARLRRAAVAAVAALAAGAAHAAPATPCRIEGWPHEVLCGQLRRPLDPAEPSGPTIAVHYVVVPATARQRHPDPVFVLAGGPGQSAIALAPYSMSMFQRLAGRRDLVFVDQRGTGRSAPLACADDPHESLAEQGDRARQVRRLVVDCLGALRRLPYGQRAGDLGRFTTPIAMQDLDAVRQALGAERINLVGASYGTRAGLDYLRQFPARVRRAVFDGVAPPDMVLPASFSLDNQAALDALLASCPADAGCAAAYPALRTQWATLLAGLPRTVTVAQPLTGRAETFTMTRDMLLGAVRSALYAPVLASALPAALAAAADGRFEPLAGVAALLGSKPATQIATGMHFSVLCAEDIPRMDGVEMKAGADFGNDFADLYRRVCADWPRGTVPAAYYTMPPSPAPVLLLSGGLDPATPPRHAERVARALGPKARHVIVPTAGHGVLGIACLREAMQRFIDADDDASAAAVDTGCAARMPRPPAFVPLAATAPSASGAAR